MLITVALVITFLACAILTVRAWRGDGRTDLRRCPRCSYDMAATDSMLCPECGHAATTESDLHHRRGNKRAFRVGLLAMLALLLVGPFLVIPGPWTTKVPRPILRLALHLAAPPPAPPRLNAGWYLPVPDITLFNSRSAWDRLTWQHQAATSLDIWVKTVLANGGPITNDELATLTPFVDQTRGIVEQSGALPAREAWYIASIRSRLASARTEAAGDANRLLRIEWALAELHFLGGGAIHRPDFARIPDAIIHQALAHPDSNVRVFGINSVGRRAYEVINNPTVPMTTARATVEALATSDPIPSLQRQASDLVSYMNDVLPKQ
jgi:hypothetical protein